MKSLSRPKAASGRKLFELSWSSRRALAGAWIGVAAASIGLRVFGLRRLRSLARRQSPTGSISAEEVERARELERLVRIAAALSLFPARCLERAVVLWKMLSRRGIEASLRIGVRKDSRALEAHAWVECGGVSLDPEHSFGEGFEPFEGSAIEPLSKRE